jgi:hypothetical protein
MLYKIGRACRMNWRVNKFGLKKQRDHTEEIKVGVILYV